MKSDVECLCYMMGVRKSEGLMEYVEGGVGVD